MHSGIVDYSFDVHRARLSRQRSGAQSEMLKELALECFTYILGSSSKDGFRTYVGWTNDLDRRLARHNAGTGARSTRGRVWVLLYAERHASREQAMSREWHLKRDRSFRRRLLQNA
jgi:putative endonuclease